MEKPKILPFESIESLFQELAAKAKKRPCDHENRCLRLAEQIRQYTADNLRILQRRFRAKETLLIAPDLESIQYLIDQLTEAQTQLESFDDWEAARLDGIDCIADQLSTEAIQLLDARQEDEEGEVQWKDFWRVIEESLVHYQKIFTWSAYFDWLKSRFVSGSELDKNTPPPTNEQSVFYIIPDARQPLYEAIEPFVDALQRPILQALFAGNIPDKRIVVHCQQNEFGAAFYGSGAVSNRMAKTLSEILPTFFVRYDGKAFRELKPSILQKHLRGLDLPK